MNSAISLSFDLSLFLSISLSGCFRMWSQALISKHWIEFVHVCFNRMCNVVLYAYCSFYIIVQCLCRFSFNGLFHLTCLVLIYVITRWFNYKSVKDSFKRFLSSWALILSVPYPVCCIDISGNCTRLEHHFLCREEMLVNVPLLSDITGRRQQLFKHSNLGSIQHILSIQWFIFLQRERDVLACGVMILMVFVRNAYIFFAWSLWCSPNSKSPLACMACQAYNL